MFSSYKNIFWISVVMAVSFYAPFIVNGFSTDVWMRLVRITEWAAAGFPFQEHLMMAQNYPLGIEMHWTRPMDWIGYILAWPFIPAFGLHDALEMMACFMPVLFLIISLGGYFYALRGYLTPKAAFFSFWLFFLIPSYSWGQASIGYFDHHIVHFALLMWCLALCARSFISHHPIQLMAYAGVLTGIGVWITPEFFINTCFIILPYAFYWLIQGRSLKPAFGYAAALTGMMLLALSFDHPMAGFLTLDLYRFSFFHIIMSGFISVILGLLVWMNPIVASSFVRRLIFGILGVSLFVTFLTVFFTDILLTPMAHPVIYHLWVKKVQEMLPLTDSIIDFVRYGIFSFITVMVLVGLFLRHPTAKKTPVLITLFSGLFVYGVIMISHVRVGISVDVFFVLSATFVLNAVFFPREKSVFKTGMFLVVYGLFIFTVIKGSGVLLRFQNWGVDYYWALYQKNENIHIPDWLQQQFEDRKNQENAENTSQKNIESLFNHKKEDEKIGCQIPEKGMKLLKEYGAGGSILSDIFQAPEIAWKTGRPVWGGPYHIAPAAHMDMVSVYFDQTDGFKTAYQLMTERQVKTAVFLNPKCMMYLFSDNDEKMRTDLDQIFYYTVYYETRKKPDWMKLVWFDEQTGIKIFNMETGE